MSENTISPLEIDEVNITLIMDNMIDVLMASSQVAKRLPLDPNPSEKPTPRAEHGFSALVEVRQGDKRGTVLFDTGVSQDGILHNMDLMKIDPGKIEAIVFSHGHPDHTMGALSLIERMGVRNLPLVLHPDACLDRKMVLPNGMEVSLPAPKIADFRRAGIEVMDSAKPSLLANNMLLVSGEVARTTEFEKGFRPHMTFRNGVWEPDPLIMDDQCAIMNVRGKGLVILTGCGHAGIINIIRYAQHLTGVDQVYAVVGGFHLTGALFEPIIPATVAALQAIGPRYVMPGHCTGWAAMHQIAFTMPEAFIPNSVGTMLVL